MWVVPPSLADMILKHYNETFALPQVSEGARAAIIGKIRTDDLYVVNYQGRELVRAKASDVTAGILYDRPHTKKTATAQEPALAEPADYNKVLLQLLAHENIASRAPVIEMYDKQVQGRTVIEAGRADAGVMQPFNEEKYPEEIRQTGIALSLDQNPRYNMIDAYWGAVNAVAESVRNVVASGAAPVAISDCLCFGNPEKPEQMSEFVESVRGIADACRAITLVDHPDATLPVIAGNVSLYNESAQGAIPPSPMISCLGVLPDVAQAVTYDLKRTDTNLIMVGDRKDECGGSVYYQLNNELGANLPKPDLSVLGAEVHAVSYVIQQGMVLSAHDISEGGIATALAEMSLRNNIGIKAEIPGTLALSKKLFSETGGFILEVKREHSNDVKNIFAEHKLNCTVIGDTNKSGKLQINGVIDIAVSEAKSTWENGLRDRLL